MVNEPTEPGTKRTQDHKPVVQCTPGGGGRCVLREPPWSIHAGRAAGTNYNVKGGTSDTLCIPETPQYLSTDTTDTLIARFGGLEYDQLGTSTTPLNNLLQANPPPLCSLPHRHQTVCSHCPCSVHLS